MTTSMRSSPESVSNVEAFDGRAPQIVVWTVALGVALASGASALRAIAIRAAGGQPDPMTLPHFLLAAAVGVTVVFAVTYGIAALRSRRGVSMPREIVRLCRCASALLVLPLLGPLSGAIERESVWPTLGLATLAGGVMTHSAYHWASESVTTQRTRAVTWIVICLAVTAYAFAATWISVSNHLSFNTGRSDLGFYVNIVRQSSQGIPLGCSLCGSGSHLSGHFDPILVLLSPIYLIYPFSETILALQSVWLASGAIPAYWLVRHHVPGARWPAVLVALAYLLHPALHGINFYDFHSLALAVPLLLWLALVFEKGNLRAYAAVVVSLLLVREDIALALVGFSLYAAVSGKPYGARVAWTTGTLAIAYFAVVKSFVMVSSDPLNAVKGHSGYAAFYEDMIPSGAGTSGLIGTLIADPVFTLGKILVPAKVEYLATLVLPLLALPLFGRGKAMLLYGIVLTLLPSRPYLFSTHFQYSTALLPFLFALATAALGRLSAGCWPLPAKVSARRLARALTVGVFVATAISSWKLGGLVDNASFRGGFRPLRRNPNPKHLAQAAWLKDVSRRFSDKSIAANSRLLTHLGSTTDIRLLNDRFVTDYVITDASGGRHGQSIRGELRRKHLKEIEHHPPLALYETHYPEKIRKRHLRKLIQTGAVPPQ